jgi:rhodanese-related sulfurtransferase
MDDSYQNKKATLDVMVIETMKKYPDVEHITCEELQEMMKETLIVDVRHKDEFLVSAIPGAVHYTVYEQMMKDKDAIFVEKTRICFYCTIGERSARYARKMKENFSGDTNLNEKKLLNLKGSILEWTYLKEGGDLVKPNPQTMMADDCPHSEKVHCFGERWNLCSDKYDSITFNWVEQAAEALRWIKY